MTVRLQRIDYLNLILDTPKGRGIFASRRIEAGTVIDTAPVIVLTQHDFEKHIQHSTLLHYSYNWPKICESTGKSIIHQAIVLGLGSMFNHSAIRQNIGWKRNLAAGVVVYSALRDIEPGEELLISYGSQLTFQDECGADIRAEEEEDGLSMLSRIDSPSFRLHMKSGVTMLLGSKSTSTEPRRAMGHQNSSGSGVASTRLTRSRAPVVEGNSNVQPATAAPALKKGGRKRKIDQENDDRDELAIIESKSTPAKAKGKGKAKAKPASVEGPSPKKQKAVIPEEKRLSRWRTQPTQKLRDRIHRCLTQRMVVLDRNRDVVDHPQEETFQIAGSTGNVYQVHITNKPSCDCPDGTKNGLCKHILYIMMKVLKAPDELVYQSALLSSELEQIFEKAPPAPARGEVKSSARKPLEEDDCPICYSEFDNEEKTVYCKAQCGTNIHEACFNQWAATKGAGKVTCVMCRQPWQGEMGAHEALAQGKIGEEGYVNVGSQLGMSGHRDMSTYHNPYDYGYGYRKRWY